MKEIEFDGSFSLEKRNENTDFALFLINGINGTDKIGESTAGNFDNVANSEGGLVFGFVLFGDFENLVDFWLGDGGRLVVNADKTGDSLGSADGDPRVVG